MPTYVITGPDGKKYRVSGQGSPEAALGALKKQLGGSAQPAPAPAPAPDVAAAAPAKERSTLDWFLGRNLSPEQQAETDAWQQSLSAKPTGPSGAENMIQGMTFNRADDMASILGAQGLADRINTNQEQFRQQHPVGSTIYEGLGAGIGAAGAGKVLSAAMPTVAAAMSPVGRTIGQRALRYSAMGGLSTGAAESGEQDATAGSIAGATAIGTGLGALTPYAGRAVQGVYNKLTKAPSAVPQIKGTLESMMQQAGDIADNFKAQATQKYNQIRQAGAVINQQAGGRLRNNMLFSAGKTNPNLAPTTAGMKQRVAEVLGNGPVDFEDVHELSMEVNLALRGNVSPNDARLLGRMKDQLDNFINGVQPQDLAAGTPEAVKMLREADSLYAQRMKMELVKTVMDNADRGTGKYTQSGVANTIRQQAESLYKQIIKGKAKGFSTDEIALIRKMAKSEDVSIATRWLAKFAGRGPVAAGMGGGLGGGAGAAIGGLLAGPPGAAIGGVIGGAAVPTAGMIAANSADKAAARSLGRLASSAAYGPAALGNIPAQLSAPLERLLLPAGVGASTAIGQRVR